MIVFRADGNRDIGLGHIMRCLSIADAGNMLGVQCSFITADEELYSIIHKRGYENIILHTDYKNLMSELAQMKDLIENIHPLALFIDSYYVTEYYLNMLLGCCQKIGCRLVYIDDICSFAYPCDILINYNIYGPGKESYYKELYKEARRFEPIFLLGTNYAPLRIEFQNLPKRTVKKTAKNILISTGGSDPEHIAKGITESIIKCKGQYQQFTFHFIIGEMNDDKEEIEKIANTCSNIFLHSHVKNMSCLMQQSDVAISAAGFTLYELCAVQIPTITYILADNQIFGAEGFCDYNVLHSVGDVRKLGVSELSDKLVKNAIDLAMDYDECVRISKIQHSIVDGKGTTRIVDSALNLKI